MSSAQEVHFFSKNFERGTDWYAAQFGSAGVPIDTSPKYFQLGATVAPRIKNTIGTDDLRFLLVLRNPVDYLFSHFRMQVRQGALPSAAGSGPQHLLELVDRDPDYLLRGMYAETLERYWLTEFPLERFKIVLFEELIADVEGVMSDILAFFGLPKVELTAPRSAQNRTLRSKGLYRVRDLLNRMPAAKRAIKRSAAFNWVYSKYLVATDEVMSAETRSALSTRFQADSQRLQALLGRSGPLWPERASTGRVPR